LEVVLGEGTDAVKILSGVIVDREDPAVGVAVQ
jgi:hypothetical protein